MSGDYRELTGGDVRELLGELLDCLAQVSGFSSVRSELRSEIGGLRAEMNARFEAVDACLLAENLLRVETALRFE